jgi:hypothetical protein
MSVSIEDGCGWPKYTNQDIKRLQALLDSLENTYDGKNGGLAGAVRDGVITEGQRVALKMFID